TLKVWLLGAESCRAKTALVVVPESPSTTTASLMRIVGSITVALLAATLFADACSGSFAEMLAVSVIVPGCVGCKVTVIAALAPLLRVPSEQTMSPPMLVQSPCDEAAEMNMTLGGRGLVMVTPLAVAGPW